jgi:hypothetical protein
MRMGSIRNYPAASRCVRFHTQREHVGQAGGSGGRRMRCAKAKDNGNRKG